MTIVDIATAAETAVRVDYCAKLIRKGVEAYEAAQTELTVRAEAAGITLSRLQLKSTAQKVAAKATA